MNEQSGEMPSERHIPHVTRATLESALASMREGDYFVRVGERLRIDQGELNSYLHDYIARSAKTDNEYNKMAGMALFVYDVITRQIEADAMNNRLNLE